MDLSLNARIEVTKKDAKAFEDTAGIRRMTKVEAEYNRETGKGWIIGAKRGIKGEEDTTALQVDIESLWSVLT